jgi:hypothetical protein
VAILAYFEKTGEDHREVSYRFGDSPDFLNREVVLEKESRRLIPGTDELTIQLMAVARKIVALEMTSGNWPDKGMTAS